MKPVKLIRKITPPPDLPIPVKSIKPTPAGNVIYNILKKCFKVNECCYLFKWNVEVL